MSDTKRGIFVCGTDTDVGKTIVSATLLANLHSEIQNLRYWKPVQTGADDSDRRTVQKLTGLADEFFLPELHHFDAPLSPHRAAELQDCAIDFNHLLEQTNRYLSTQPLVVEGAGGLLVPLNRKFTWFDFLKETRIHVLLVARSGLGTINHSLLTIQKLRSAGITLAGIVFCGPNNPDNIKTVCEMGDVPALGAFHWSADRTLPAIFSKEIIKSFK